MKRQSKCLSEKDKGDKIQIKEIDFSDVIMKAIPVLREKAPNDGSAISKIISVVTQLPSKVICTMLDAVSQDDKYEIVALLVRDNQEKLKKMLSQFPDRYGQSKMSFGNPILPQLYDFEINVIGCSHQKTIRRHSSIW